jgi:hypothetical protein
VRAEPVTHDDMLTQDPVREETVHSTIEIHRRPAA